MNAVIRFEEIEEVQYDLFRSRQECELEALRNEIAKVRVSSDKVRRGTYARLNEQKKLVDEMMSRMEIIERNICQKN